MPDDDQIDPQRRALLRRIGLAGTLAYAAPVLTALGVARASGASGGSGASGAGGRARNSGASRPVPRRSVPQPARAQPMRRAAPPPPPPDPELVLMLPADAPPEVLATAGYRVLAEAPGLIAGARLMRLGLPPGRSPAAARAEIAALIPAAISDANHLYTPDEMLCTDDGCAAHALINWSGWPSAFSPRIGMIDTGINTAHAALAGQKLTVHQMDLDSRPAAGRQHGTAVAALLLGRLDSRTPGLLPHAELIAVEAFHRSGGAEAADAFALVQALQYMLDAQVQVVNMSFSGPENAVLHRLVAELTATGIGLVAAAGNGGPGAAPAFPAAWPEVIAVTAVDAGLAPYRQANRGPYVTFAAPGVNLWTAASVSGGRLRSGTSYAAPFVTAALAVARMRQPDVPLAEVVAGLIGCARDLGDAGFDDTFGHGLISAPDQCFADEAQTISEKYLTSGE